VGLTTPPRILRLVEASEGSQGPCRAVEPMMMIYMVLHNDSIQQTTQETSIAYCCISMDTCALVPYICSTTTKRSQSKQPTLLIICSLHDMHGINDIGVTPSVCPSTRFISRMAGRIWTMFCVDLCYWSLL
jgi:hypothetical protein